MALTQSPVLETRTIQGDGTTIKYDITKDNRSDAVGKLYKLNSSGKGELVQDGDAWDGVVIAVNDGDRFTGAYSFGGLSVPIGTGATVNIGDSIIGALGPSSARGYAKAVAAFSTLSDIAADADIDSSAEARTAANAERAEIRKLMDRAKSKGTAVNKDTTHVLISTL